MELPLQEVKMATTGEAEAATAAVANVVAEVTTGADAETVTATGVVAVVIVAGTTRTATTMMTSKPRVPSQNVATTEAEAVVAEATTGADAVETAITGVVIAVATGVAARDPPQRSQPPVVTSSEMGRHSKRESGSQYDVRATALTCLCP